MTNRWGDRALGWTLSAGIHLVLILGAALVFIEQLLAVDVEPDCTVCGVHDPMSRIAPDGRRDLLERTGVDSELGQPFDAAGELASSSEALESLLPGSGDIFAYPYRASGQAAPSPLAGSAERPQRSSEARTRILGLRREGGNPRRVFC